MTRSEEIKKFYLEHIGAAKMEGTILKAPCPICLSAKREKPGRMIVHLEPKSFFTGYFRCLNRCTPGGFPLYFGRIMGIDPEKVPGYDPDREFYIKETAYPSKDLKTELKKFKALMSDTEYDYFRDFGISRRVVDELQIGYNGRYLVYPYFLEDGNCYAVRCVVPGHEDDSFWHGDEAFFGEEFQIFQVQELERCENGAIFVTEGENNFMMLKELGYPAIAVPTSANLEALSNDHFSNIHHVFLVLKNAPEARISAREFATRLGFKARILQWPSHHKRGYDLCQLAREEGKSFRAAVSMMVRTSESFSPFSSPEKEHIRIIQAVEKDRGKRFLGLMTGMEKLDKALNGISGINIMGGQPKAGKSCFFMQISSTMAERGVPVVYYDFENGRQKIYLRTLCRLSRLSEEEIRATDLEAEAAKRLESAYGDLKGLLQYFRVVTDRKLNPDFMRRHVDFLRHETGADHTIVVIDSLHKLPFENLSERRRGIDEWLRHMEAIRDEQDVTFLVISELSRDADGGYSKKPDLGSFKESGDIEYSADNAMILSPNWDPLAPFSEEPKNNTLWLAASRENSPGKIAEYTLDYPYWGFKEV